MLPLVIPRDGGHWEGNGKTRSLAEQHGPVAQPLGLFPLNGKFNAPISANIV